VAKNPLCMAVFSASLMLLSTIPALAADPAAAASPAPASNESTAQLRAEADMLRAKIDDINSRLAELEAAKTQHDKALDKTVTAGSFPGSYKVPGTNTSIGIHGFVNLVGFYDKNEYLGDKFAPGNITPPGPARNQSAGSWHMQTKLTRLTFESRTPTSSGPFRTYIATDFYGFENGGSGGQQAIQNNSYSLRIHQAYATLGRFLAGMTWSNFVDDPDSYEKIDSAGPTGLPSQRIPQIRYTMPLGGVNFSVSAENPVTDYADSLKAGNNELTSKYNPTPDFAFKLETEKSWGRAQLSGVVRQLAYADTAGHKSTATGGGLVAGGTFFLNPQKDYVGGQAWYGDGIAKYTPDDFGPVSSAQIQNTNTATQRLVPTPEHGMVVYGDHHWSKVMRSNLAFGWNVMGWQNFIPLDASEPVLTRTLHLNTIWSPIPQADFGIEWMRGTKKFRSGLNLPDTSAERWEFGTRFRF
jgi:hypothetical protein